MAPAPPQPVPAAINSLAVLSLENLSGDPSQEYFADGVTDALTTELARIGSLRVTSRTSALQYKGKRTPLPQIARELGVDAIVDGSVVREGNRYESPLGSSEAAPTVTSGRAVTNATSVTCWTCRLRLPARSQSGCERRLSASDQNRLRSSRAVHPEAYNQYLRGEFSVLSRRRWMSKQPSPHYSAR